MMGFVGNNQDFAAAPIGGFDALQILDYEFTVTTEEGPMPLKASTGCFENTPKTRLRSQLMTVYANQFTCQCRKSLKNGICRFDIGEQY